MRFFFPPTRAEGAARARLDFFLPSLYLSPLPARPYPFSPLLRYLSQRRADAFHLRPSPPPPPTAVPLPLPLSHDALHPAGGALRSVGGASASLSPHRRFPCLHRQPLSSSSGCRRHLSSPDPAGQRLLGGVATLIWLLLLSLGFSTANQRVGGSPAHRRRDCATAGRRLPAARRHGGLAESSARPSLSCVICFVVCLDYLLSCDLF